MGQEHFPVAEPTRYKLTVEEFLALDDAGFFFEHGRHELIDGDIYQMSPLHVPHARASRVLCSLIEAAIKEAGLHLEVIGTVSMRLGHHSLPEPDLVVVGPEVGDKFVELDAARIAIEISDSSLGHDLKRKAALYGSYGVAEYWVVDLNNRAIHQMTDPTPEGYAGVGVHPFGARVASKLVPQIVLDSARLA
ncbi:Uma2 family endonuclease [Sphingomonas sp. S1-29]|uniref:Uma2 family endonuclease n=1 Tax=Sphingomonas sp. S1-29 TaxID=2991074 RepID=UPI00223FEC3B|nr:Uma2 family endonuclease [Sphingomonas sp. S1-29]UZK71138.1 Uma2 family endonuclease [Sphingomonas sp. S1-29]